MIYKDFQGKKLSALGFGGMRLPIKNGNYKEIDEQATAEMVEYAINHGVNYFDTAWGYHDGQSETVMGKVLKKYPREKFYLATKFPGYDLGNMGKTQEIFEQQLVKCGVDYFDFYLFHNLCELNVEAYLNDEKYGTYSYLIEQKRIGRIKHLGFSAHADIDSIKRFLEAYGKDMEFCQLQINYIDWNFQQAKEKVELLEKWNIPVWVMEPLRGGKLCALPPEDEAKLKVIRPSESATSVAFRFLQAIPSVKMILSGMSELKQVKENIEIFGEEKPLTSQEIKTVLEIAEDMVKRTALPCTECRYCTGHCPISLDIPRFIRLYNEHKFTGGGFIAPMALGAIPKEKQPSACLHCRSCEAVCPQTIKISEMMTDFTAQLKN